MSFLLVSRVTIGLGRYNEARDGLGVMYREQRELVQNLVIYSDHCLDRAAKEWRQECVYRSMILLQVIMAVIDYPTTKVPAWNISELTGEEAAYGTTSVQQTLIYAKNVLTNAPFLQYRSPQIDLCSLFSSSPVGSWST